MNNRKRACLTGIACLTGLTALTPAEPVSAERILRVVSCMELPPYEYYNEENVPAGADIEIAELLAEDLGMEAHFSNLPYDELGRAIKEGKADIAISFIPVQDIQGDIICSQSYFSANQKVIVHADQGISEKDQLNGKLLGRIRTFPVAREEAVFLRLRNYATLEGMLRDLKNRKLDGLITDEYTAGMLAEADSDLCVLEDTVGVIDYGVLIGNQNEDFAADIAESVAFMQESGEIQKIYEKYLGPEEEIEEET